MVALGGARGVDSGGIGAWWVGNVVGLEAEMNIGPQKRVVRVEPLELPKPLRKEPPERKDEPVPVNP